MDQFKELFTIVTPLYALLIIFEMVMSHIHDRHYYTAKDTFTNVLLSSINFLLDIGVDLFLRFILGFTVLEYFYQFRFVDIENPWLYWVSLLVIQDLAFYFLHRVDHYCRFFWAVHVTHHSSEEFNLTVGFRSSVFQPLYRFFWYIPLALLGFKAVDIMLMYSITQIYGILIHTRFVKKLGILEWFMATPSHHRVHHGSNVRYLDKNMGMVFIFWDKLFGTFEEEHEEVRYGLTQNVGSHHPIKVVFHEWIAIYKDVKNAPDIKSAFMYIFGPPGWSHDGSRKTSAELRREQQQQQKEQKEKQQQQEEVETREEILILDDVTAV